MGYRLERRIAPANEANTTQRFETVHTENALMNYYEDADVKEGVTYEYRLFSQGAHGIESDPSVVLSCFVLVVKPLSISSLQVQKTTGGYRLAWEETEQENIESYKVYRVQENQPPQLLAKMKKNETSYFDTVKEDKMIYLYSVLAFIAVTVVLRLPKRPLSSPIDWAGLALMNAGSPRYS